MKSQPSAQQIYIRKLESKIHKLENHGPRIGALTVERDQLRTALRETREALKIMVSETPMSVEETAILQAVLARHAALAEGDDRG